MSVKLEQPGVDDLGPVLDTMCEWQRDGAPVPLHPGDLSWNWRFGAEVVAAAVRTWTRDGRLLALGLLDGPGLIRLAMDPDAQQDEELAQQMLADVGHPERGVLPAGSIAVEARWGGALHARAIDGGWHLDDPWTPLVRHLAEPVEDCGLRIEIAGPDHIEDRVAVQRAAFENSTFTVERWYTMAAGPGYVDARCLVGYDDEGVAVAAATVWSAGEGRPGLLEPVGVHPDHRGRRYGTAISVASAAALREMGSSSATVCTSASKTAAVATYKSAGFVAHPDVRDLHRPA